MSMAKDTKLVRSGKAASELNLSPIDHGFAWIIVAASGMTFFLGGGFNRSYTLVYQKLITMFGESATATAWVNALHVGVKMCSSKMSFNL